MKTVIVSLLSCSKNIYIYINPNKLSVSKATLETEMYMRQGQIRLP